ncbi:uncharacterized protein LOC134270140 [Saccostrea cucullata]|uniref:uncharacterized protein LOC134270140 n=1 Tax=Saccostrea cuccullata TaxID=36930 RepID=UPI002ED32C37
MIVHVTFSGFTSDEKVELLAIAKRIDSIKVEESLTEQVTHLIMKTDENDMKFCNRTLKYLRGVSKKCWVLNAGWITDSAMSGKLLSEENYEITGNIIDVAGTRTRINHFGPRKARRRRGKLFSHLKFHLIEESEAMCTEDAVFLITQCGGHIVQDTSAEIPNLILYLGDCETENKGTSIDSCVRDLHNVQDVPIIEREWLIDCISSYTRKCFKEYMFQVMPEESGTPEREDEEWVDNSFDEDYMPSPSELINFDSSSSNESATSPIHHFDASLTDSAVQNQSIPSLPCDEALADKENSFHKESIRVQQTHNLGSRKLINFDSSSSNESATSPIHHFDASLTDSAVQNQSIPSLPCDEALADKENSFHKESIRVQQTHNLGSRKYDKQFMCLFCETPQAKLPRHFKSKHSNEIDVARYLAEQDPSVKNKMLKRLRNLGAHQHNLNVIREKKGSLIVAYRQSEETHWSEYSPCPHCLGYYTSCVLWKHVRRCELAPSQRQKYGKILHFSKMLMPASEGEMSVGLRKIFITMKEDIVSTAVKNDYLIRQLGEKLACKHGNNGEQFHYIRNCLREMGRLLLSLRKQTGADDAELSSFIDPRKFDIVVQSTKEVSGFSMETTKYKTPSLALKIGYSLKKCAGIMKGNALRTGDSEVEAKASKFIELYELKWNEEITPHAYRTLEEMRRNRVHLIPLTNDVILLNNYLQNEFQKAYDRLTEEKSNKDAWSLLCELILAQIILFNRRRQGEASKMKVVDYDKKHRANQEDVLTGLTDLEKNLCARLEKVDIVGKKGRTVPVILTSKITSGINLLLKTRKDVGVAESNSYIFARTSFNSNEHVRGCDVLRDFSNKCGAEHPELLRSMKLRKHIATLSQILNLKENEVDILATFLGHDIKTHREYYRLPEEAIQVAKVSKLLLTLERGELALQKGLSLDEIEVDLEEEIVMNEEEEVDEDDEDQGIHTEDMDETGASIPTLSDEVPEVHVHELHTHTKKRVPWSIPEKKVVLNHFKKTILLGRLPGKKDIEDLIKADKKSILTNRSWKNIKDFIRNHMTSINRKK